MEPLDGCLELNAQPLLAGETSKPSQNQSSKKYSNRAENVTPLAPTEHVNSLRQIKILFLQCSCMTVLTHQCHIPTPKYFKHRSYLSGFN
jgi:hypothetical protein